jgi:diacylglycerol kinase family enzyme
VLRVAGAALGIGPPTSKLKVRYFDRRIDVPKVLIRGHGPFPYQVDGDYLGEVESLELRHEPDALRLVLPHS